MSYFFCPPEDKDLYVMYAITDGIRLPPPFKLEWNMRTNRMSVNGVLYMWVEPEDFPKFSEGNSTHHTILLKQMADPGLLRARFPGSDDPYAFGYFAQVDTVEELLTYYVLHTIVEEDDEVA
jgi:hypothetical protein